MRKPPTPTSMKEKESPNTQRAAGQSPKQKAQRGGFRIYITIITITGKNAKKNKNRQKQSKRLPKRNICNKLQRRARGRNPVWRLHPVYNVAMRCLGEPTIGPIKAINEAGHENSYISDNASARYSKKESEAREKWRKQRSSKR